MESCDNQLYSFDVRFSLRIDLTKAPRRHFLCCPGIAHRSAGRPLARGQAGRNPVEFGLLGETRDV